MGKVKRLIRPATRDDALPLAEFIDMAGEGLPRYLWASMAEPGKSVWDVGVRRALRSEGGFSYLNAYVAEIGTKAAGTVIGYQLSDVPVEIGPDFPPMFAPLQELENEAAGSWYINVMAVDPAHRGKGIGGMLLAHAENLARSSGNTQMSLIVFNQNLGARRLYERFGFREIAQRPIIKEDWECESDYSVLMVKSLEP